MVGIDLTNPHQININKNIKFTKGELLTSTIIGQKALKIHSKNGSLIIVSGSSSLEISDGKIVANTERFEIKSKFTENRSTIPRHVVLLSENQTNSADFAVQNLTLRGKFLKILTNFLEKF